MTTAEGLPCTVTVTRSCWEVTRPTSSERCDFTSANDKTAIVTRMTNNGALVHGNGHRLDSPSMRSAGSTCLAHVQTCA